MIWFLVPPDEADRKHWKVLKEYL